MIAVLLSGGVDSAAAAIVLHEKGENIIGITMSIDDGIPDDEHIKSATALCKKLGVDHHIIDIRKEFNSIKEYFCNSYLDSETPNPCAICNMKIKFGLLYNRAVSLGAETIATGHYADIKNENGRFFLKAASWKNSQEYFIALVSQEVLGRVMFPMSQIGRDDAESLLSSLGMGIKMNPSSQDVCFIKDSHISFIQNATGYKPEPGPILNLLGKRIGTHKGAIYYTIGQRKGLVSAFGKKVYVLGVDTPSNSVTVGNRTDWPHKGFFIRDVNYQKIEAASDELSCLVKVRYKQSTNTAIIKKQDKRLWVEYPGLWAPGQLCVAYDSSGAVLLAGIIEKPIT